MPAKGARGNGKSEFISKEINKKMSKNEEQFYGMFKEAFDNFSPEVPVHLYDNVRAGMVRTGFAWKKWSAVLLLFIAAASVTWTAWPEGSSSGKSIAKGDISELPIRSAFVEHTVSEPTQVSAVANNSTGFSNGSKQSSASTYKANQQASSIEPLIQQEQETLVRMDEVVPVLNETPIEKAQIENETINEMEPVTIDSGATKVVWPIKVKRTVTIDE